MLAVGVRPCAPEAVVCVTAVQSVSCLTMQPSPDTSSVESGLSARQCTAPTWPLKVVYCWPEESRGLPPSTREACRTSPPAVPRKMLCSPASSTTACNKPVVVSVLSRAPAAALGQEWACCARHCLCVSTRASCQHVGLQSRQAAVGPGVHQRRGS